MKSRDCPYRRARWTAFAGFLGSAVTVAGPALSADVPAARSTATTAPPFEAPSVTDPLLEPPPPAPRAIRSWDDALSMLRAQSPDYVTAYENVVRAQAQSRIALAAVLPTLNGQGSYTHQFFTETIPLSKTISFTVPAPDTFALTGTAQWNVLNPRALYAVGTADRNVEATRLGFEDRRRVIATGVVNAMLSTLAAARVAELNRVGLRSSLERLALTQARLQYGQGTQLDVDRAEQDAAASRAQIISGDESLRQSREALGVALGSPVAIAAPGDLDLDQFEAAVARTCHLNDDIEKRPDVASARLRVELAQRGVHDAELVFSPSLMVEAQASASTAASLGPLNQALFEAVVNVPLYDGGVRYGMLRDTRAALEQARQALVTTRLAAIVSATQAERAVSVYRASRDVAQQQRDLAARIDRRTRDGYAQGSGSSLDLVVSAQALRQADINLVLLDVQLEQARAGAVLANAECIY